MDNVKQDSLFSSNLFKYDAILSEPTITIVRDSTDAQHGHSLILHLTQSIVTNSSPQILFLSTRSRTNFSTFKTIDPFLEFETTPTKQHAMNTILHLIDVHSNPKPNILVIECLHSLVYAFSIDALAFIRTLTSKLYGLSVIISAPVASGIDKQISNLSSISTNVIDLSDLKTGVSVDIDGIITTSKREGNWINNPQQRRYKMMKNGFTIL